MGCSNYIKDYKRWGSANWRWCHCETGYILLIYICLVLSSAFLHFLFRNQISSFITNTVNCFGLYLLFYSYLSFPCDLCLFIILFIYKYFGWFLDETFPVPTTNWNYHIYIALGIANQCRKVLLRHKKEPRWVWWSIGGMFPLWDDDISKVNSK
jgi:hypothetical protein